jgi:stress response protein YsnF
MPEQAPLGEAVIPLAEEVVSVSKREVETGRVQVALTTEAQTVIAREVLRGRRVEDVPVGRTLAEGEAPPQSREEGDTLVIPVFEEVAVVVKRLVLREEVRLHFAPTEQPFEETVEVRRQRAAVERVPTAAERDTR